MWIPFNGVPPNSLVTVRAVEYESNEALAAVLYPMELAGATVWAVPVLEIPVGRVVTAEKKYRKWPTVMFFHHGQGTQR
jgi:hypothetical protein